MLANTNTGAEGRPMPKDIEQGNRHAPEPAPVSSILSPTEGPLGTVHPHHRPVAPAARSKLVWAISPTI
ncbi:hypothetical protein AJ88_35770 [Mesorhizobium amorphae CCBAU 01583]|nr:hypothetical protein AJ88_35770 [Mesorhizobium amorphae CCBAU 01583]